MNITFTYNNKVHEIRFDGQSYIPQRRADGVNRKTGEQADGKLRDDGYFKNLGGAVKRIVDNEMGADESTVPLMDYVRRWESAVREIRSIIEEDEF